MIQLTYLVHTNTRRGNSLVSNPTKEKFRKLIDLITSFFGSFGKQQNASSSPSLADKIAQDTPEKKEIVQGQSNGIIQHNKANPTSTSGNDGVMLTSNFDPKELRKINRKIKDQKKKQSAQTQEEKPTASPGIVLSTEEVREKLVPTQVEPKKEEYLIMQPEDFMLSPVYFHFPTYNEPSTLIPGAFTPVYVEEKKPDIKKETPITPKTIPIDLYNISLPKTVGSCLGEVKKSIRKYNEETDLSEKLKTAQEVLAAYDALMQHEDYKTAANPLLRDLFADGSSQEEIKVKLSAYEQGKEKFKTELQNLQKKLSQ